MWVAVGKLEEMMLKGIQYWCECVVVQILFQLSHYDGWDMPQLPGDPELGTRLRK